MQSSDDVHVPLRTSREFAGLGAFFLLAALGGLTVTVVAPLDPGMRAALVLPSLSGLVAAGLMLFSARRGALRLTDAGIDVVAAGSRRQTIPWDAVGSVGPRPVDVPEHDGTWAVGVARKRALLQIQLTRPLTLRVATGNDAQARPIARLLLAPIDVDAAAAALSRRPSATAVAAAVAPVAATAPAASSRGLKARLITTAVVVVALGAASAIKAVAFPDAGQSSEQRSDATEGRSDLEPVPVVPGAVAFRGVAADGSLLYAWRTGGVLRLRVDSSAQPCPGLGYDAWWDSVDRPGTRVGADGRFRGSYRTQWPVDDGLDVMTARWSGTFSADVLHVRFDRVDDYRGIDPARCPRGETFTARRVA